MDCLIAYRGRAVSFPSIFVTDSTIGRGEPRTWPAARPLRLAPRMRRSIAVCWILVVGCTAAVDPLAPGDVGRYWAALRGHGHAQSAQTYWFEWKPQTLDWNWAYQGPHRHAPAGEPPTGDAPLTEWVTGLAPATAYDYRICGIADGDTRTACTDPGSFTRLLLVR